MKNYKGNVENMFIAGCPDGVAFVENLNPITEEINRYNNFVARCKEFFEIDSENASIIYDCMYAYITNDIEMIDKICNCSNHVSELIGDFFDELRIACVPMAKQVVISIIVSLIGKANAETFNCVIDKCNYRVEGKSSIRNIIDYLMSRDTNMSSWSNKHTFHNKIEECMNFIENCKEFFGVFTYESYFAYDLLFAYATKDIPKVELIIDEQAIHESIKDIVDIFISQIPSTNTLCQPFKEFFDTIFKHDRYRNVRLCHGIINDNATDISIQGLADVMKVLLSKEEPKTEPIADIKPSVKFDKQTETIHIPFMPSNFYPHIICAENMFNSSNDDQIKKDDERILKELETDITSSEVGSMTESVQTKDDTELDKRIEKCDRIRLCVELLKNKDEALYSKLIDIVNRYESMIPMIDELESSIQKNREPIERDNNNYYKEFTEQLDRYVHSARSESRLNIIKSKLCNHFGIDYCNSRIVQFIKILAYCVDDSLPKPDLDDTDLRLLFINIRTILDFSKKHSTPESYKLYSVVCKLIYDNVCDLYTLCGFIKFNTSFISTDDTVTKTLRDIVAIVMDK